MSTLELRGVERRYAQGAVERVVLRDISLALESGELVAVWGLRRCGRTTLLRVAAGVEPVSGGTVWLHGRDLAEWGPAALGSEVGYCRRPLRDLEAAVNVLEGMMFFQLARGVRAGAALERASLALERTGAIAYVNRAPRELKGAELTRVMLARAITLAPSLLVVDDPLVDVDLLERDAVLALLRSLADDGVAILMSATDATHLRGADRALALSEGELRGSRAPELAEVLPLRRRRSA